MEDGRTEKLLGDHRFEEKALFWNFERVEEVKTICLFFKSQKNKGDYPRTRASDSKHLPAVILNVFFGEYTRVMFNIVISTKKIKFHHGFL